MNVDDWKAKLNDFLQKSAAGRPISERDKIHLLYGVYGDGVIEGRKRQRQELKEKLVKGEINVSISVEGL